TNIQDGLTTVSVNGLVRGLESRNAAYLITESKYDAAQSKFSNIAGQILTRAQIYAGINLNITPKSTVVGRNPPAGTISYAYEYDNRPSTCIANALFEDITITDNNHTDIFAAIPV